jgi:hypothetical protein
MIVVAAVSLLGDASPDPYIRRARRSDDEVAACAWIGEAAAGGDDADAELGLLTA